MSTSTPVRSSAARTGAGGAACANAAVRRLTAQAQTMRARRRSNRSARLRESDADGSKNRRADNSVRSGAGADARQAAELDRFTQGVMYRRWAGPQGVVSRLF